MTSMSGTIEKFWAIIGRSPATDEARFEPFMDHLDDQPEATPFDRGDGRQSTYWSFYAGGVELMWSDKVLMSAVIYLQADADEGYQAYSSRLFGEFDNLATMDEVIEALGEPDTRGQWKGPWIRYDHLGPGQLRFEFDEAGRAVTVSLSAPPFG